MTLLNAETNKPFKNHWDRWVFFFTFVDLQLLRLY